MKTHWKCRTGISLWAICFSLVGIWASTSSIWAQSVGGIPDAEQRMVWRMNPSIFQYEKSYNGITITGIEPWDEEDDVYQTIPYAVQVPDKIDGLPVTSIGRNAFANGYGMIRIVLPESITSIGNGAFAWCNCLTTFTIPKNVTTLGDGVFERCTELRSVFIPQYVTSMSEDAWLSCTSLESIQVSSKNSVYQSIDGVLLSKDGTTLLHYPAGRKEKTYTIPAGVTTISDEAFEGCGTLTKVVLPESLTTIGKMAFYGCGSLADVTLPNSVATIGSSAFYGCCLKSITLPNGLTTIGKMAFYGCNGLANITIPAGTTTLGDCLANCHTLRIEVSPDNSFYQSIDGVLFSKDGTTLIRYPSNRRKKSYTLPEGVTTIGDNAFMSCTSLKTLTLPEGVTTIGDHAFTWSNLKNITLPASVTTIGVDTFTACLGLQSINVSPENAFYQSIDGVLYSKDGTILCCYPASREGESYTFPEGVTTIRYHAFYESRRLRSLTLPETITTVEKLAFDRCKSLKTFVPNMAAMEEGAFDHFANLERIQFPEGLTTIPNGSLARCQKLGSIQIPASVTTIGNRVFEDCKDLQYIGVSPDNSVYQSINGVLYSKDGTTLIRFPCLHSDPRPDEIPESVTTIGERAFAGCRYLRSLAICPNVTTIGDGAFEDCPNLKLLRRNIPLQRNSFGDFAAIRREKSINPASDFEYQTHDGTITITKLKNLRICGLVQIPDEIDGLPVTTIGNSAFSGCRLLKKITIPQHVASIGNSVFACEKLSFIDVSPDNPSYQSIDGVLFSKDGTTLIRYPAVREGESYTIPKGVTTISGGAFAVCNNLTTLSIPESVTTIGDEAFVACDHLTTLSIPEGVTTIGDNAFANCGSLTTLSIPEGVTTIGNNAFTNCGSLTTLSIPESVTSIGKECFARCKCLESINVSPENDVYRSIDGVLLSQDGTTLIRYPIGHKETSYTIPAGVTTIQKWAFADCEALTSLTFSDSVTTIDEMAFDRCTRLTTLSIPASVTNIGRNAFVHCERISMIDVSPENMSYQSIDGVLFSKDGTTLCCYPAGREGESYSFPERVTTIGYGAFDGNRFLVILTIPKSVTTLGCGVFIGCTNLTTIVIPDSVTTIGRNLRESYLALTIWTPRDSAAEKYAKENKIRFEPYPQPTT